MPFNNDEDNAYLDLQLKMALDSWDPAKPRRWLARYGGSGIQIISATLMDEWREVANC